MLINLATQQEYKFTVKERVIFAHILFPISRIWSILYERFSFFGNVSDNKENPEYSRQLFVCWQIFERRHVIFGLIISHRCTTHQKILLNNVRILIHA